MKQHCSNIQRPQPLHVGRWDIGQTRNSKEMSNAFSCLSVTFCHFCWSIMIRFWKVAEMGDKSSIFCYVNAWTLFFKSIFADISVKLIETIPNWLSACLQCADCSDWRTEENFRSNPVILRQALRSVFFFGFKVRLMMFILTNLCELLFLRTYFVSSATACWRAEKL